MVLEQFDNIIKQSKNILLVSHINPDGDTLGSMCGLFSLIKDNYKKICDMVAVSNIPLNYEFLPYADLIKHIDDLDLSREYDLVVTLDIATPERCAGAQILFDKAKNTVNIDHHETNSCYGQLDIVNPSASATTEILYETAKQLKWKISYDTAVCLYVGIMTDTGSFRFSNTTKEAMVYAGELISLGVRPDDIYQKCYESCSRNMVMFQAFCVSKAQFEKNERIAYTIVYKKDLENFHNEGEDFTEGLTEKLRAMKNTEIAFVIKELNGSSKLSMRSKSVNVADICAKFGGGGHKLAAGAVIKAKPEHAAIMVLDEISKQQKIC